MRKEIYEALSGRLTGRIKMIGGEHKVLLSDEDAEEYADAESVIRHVDLWNHNVEFIEQEEGWERPAVFVEFGDIPWTKVHGGEEFTTKSKVALHVVTDWAGSTSSGSDMRDEGLEVFDLVNEIHEVLQDLGGDDFFHLNLVESRTNHNHEEIVEMVEVYEYRGRKAFHGI